MRYDIFLTQATPEAKAELAKHFDLCTCCDFDGVIWLDAIYFNGDISIHGVGYYCDGDELPVASPSPEKIARFYVNDALAHGNTVILTPDVNEFTRLLTKLKSKYDESDNDD